MADSIINKIAHLVTLYAGIKIREQDYDQFSQKVFNRVKALGALSLEDYYQLLLKNTEINNTVFKPAEGQRSQELDKEWRELLASVTITETYFLRDQNQFALLKNQVLPDIIERKQRSTPLGQVPKLRVWSAGCSTGEEIYSIAILLEELKFPWDKWAVHLVGTDINYMALEAARQGRYSSWSFRQLDPELQKKYFKHWFQSWHLHGDICKRVVFQPGNLMHMDLPSWQQGLYDFDLIICRNVFIYFEFQAIAHILQKFYNTLAPQGYLLTGHTELYGQDLSLFATRNFAEAIVYQKQNSLDKSSSVKNSGLTNHFSSTSLGQPQANSLDSNSNTQALGSTTLPNSSRQSQSPADPLTSLLITLRSLLERQNYPKVIESAYQALSTYPNSFDIYLICAEAHANLGDYSKGKSACWKALEIQEFATAPYFILAQISEEENNLDMAIDYLKKIIYLDPEAVIAYLELSSIYTRKKDLEKAKKMKQSALTILKKMPLSLKQQNYYLGDSWDSLEEHLIKTKI